MARTANGAGGRYEIAIYMQSAGDIDGESQERSLLRFVRCVTFFEWAGNASGALVFFWATVVLLAGFRSSLTVVDFWLTTLIVFVEAFRIFSRGSKLDNQSLFGTPMAFRRISSSFIRMLAQPQKGNEMVLIIGFYCNLVDLLFGATVRIPVVPVQLTSETIRSILKVATLVVMTKLYLRRAIQLTNGWPKCRQWLLWIILVLTPGTYAYITIRYWATTTTIEMPTGTLILFPEALRHPYAVAEMLNQVCVVFAAFALSLRPPCIANLTTSPILLITAKAVSAGLLFSKLAMPLFFNLPLLAGSFISIIRTFTMVVLSIGSLQKQTASNNQNSSGLLLPTIVSRLTAAADISMHIPFLLDMMVPILPLLLIYWAGLSREMIDLISYFILLVALLIGNLQIPVAVVQVVLSSLRLHKLQAHEAYDPMPKDSNQNLVPAIVVFYALALCQGLLYIMACIIGRFSSIPCRSLVRRLGLKGQRGAKAVDKYFQHAYTKRMEIGVFAAGDTAINLSSFAIESLSSASSSQMQQAGVWILDRLLQHRDYSEQLIAKLTSSTSNEQVCTLISMLMLSSIAIQDRIVAARVTAKLSSSLRISRISGMLKMVSWLLDAEDQQLNCASGPGGNVPLDRGSPVQTARGKGGAVVVVGSQRSDQSANADEASPEEPPFTPRHSLLVLAMEILERLARDLDNCVEIGRATDLISKIIRFISYTSDTSNGHDAQQNVVICSSLKFVRTLTITGGSTGTELRKELRKNPFLLNNLECILEDNRSSPEVWEPAMEIIAKLALDDELVRKEIGSTKVIMSKLMQVFLGGYGPENKCYDQPLRMVAGEALANLAMESVTNCLAILVQSRHHVIRELTDLLHNDEYICLAGSLLQNLCVYCRDMLSHPDKIDLMSTFPKVMENIRSAEGKQLEVLIGLASSICYAIPERCAEKFEEHTNQASLVKKLVDTLNSNRKPSPEYPSMRRFILDLTIFVVRLCPRCSNIFRQQGMMDALFKVEKTPSKVESYRVFYGNIGVVPESGMPLHTLVDIARKQIIFATPPVAWTPASPRGTHEDIYMDIYSNNNNTLIRYGAGGS